MNDPFYVITAMALEILILENKMGRMLRRMAQCLAYLHRCRWERRQCLHVLELEDYLLDDIGLTRYQVACRLREVQGLLHGFQDLSGVRDGRRPDWFHGGFW